MDFDEVLDGPTRPPAFAPKFKPKPKPKTEPQASEMDIDVEISNNVMMKEEEQTDNLMESEEPKESEDELFREIDVYFTPPVDPSTGLYVLQYPLRPVWRPYDLDERCQEVRMKPDSAQLEVDLSVDVNSKNYDPDNHLGLQMKKETLCTTWKPPHTSQYTVGVFSENKLHLNPIHAVVQLRPSMKHFDSRESKKPRNNPEQNNDSSKGWVPLKYHSTRSDMAADHFQKMMTRESSQIYFSMNSCDYLDRLCPGTPSDSFSSKGPSRRVLLTLPLKERFRNWLLKGPPVHRFDALKHLAPDESVEEVLGVLQENCRLVQGLWVPKSPLVYGTDQGFQVLARDFVLLLFTKNVTINSTQIPQRPQFVQAMKNVLNVLAIERPTFSDWKLKELPDVRFTKLHPSIVKKQEQEWEILELNINKLFEGRKVPGTRASSSKSTTTTTTTTTSNNPSTTSSNRVSAMSAEVRDATTKALQKLFQTIKVCSYQQISQRLKDMAVSEGLTAVASSIDAYRDEVQAITSEVAVNIHGLCVRKSSPDYPQYDAFRKVVIDLFVAQGPNAKLKKAPIIEAAKMELKRDIPSIEYQKVLQELCISQGSAWVLRSSSD